MGGSYDGGGIDAHNKASVSAEHKKWADDRTQQLDFIGKVLKHGLLDSKFVTFGNFDIKTLFLSRFSLKGPTSWRLEPTFDANGDTASSFHITNSRHGASMTKLYSYGEGAQLVKSTYIPEIQMGFTNVPHLKDLTSAQDKRTVDHAVRLALSFVERNIELETRTQLSSPRG